MQFKYKITKFDAENNFVWVVFDDGSWAEIKLANPLPASIEDLEKIISMYTAPKEAIEAQTAPTADLSYINSFVEVERTANRFSLKGEPAQDIDPAVLENVKMGQDLNFEKQVAAALVKFGVIAEDPTNIPVTSI